MSFKCVLPAVSFRWALTRAVLYTYPQATEGEKGRKGERESERKRERERKREKE